MQYILYLLFHTYSSFILHLIVCQENERAVFEVCASAQEPRENIRKDPQLNQNLIIKQNNGEQNSDSILLNDGCVTVTTVLGNICD